MSVSGNCTCCDKKLNSYEECQVVNGQSQGVCDTCLVIVRKSFYPDTEINRAHVFDVLMIDPEQLSQAKKICKAFVEKRDRERQSPDSNVAYLSDYRDNEAKRVNKSNRAIKRSTKNDPPPCLKISPSKVKDVLNERIVGNEKLKRDLGVLISKNRSGMFKKNFVGLIIGESGSGKTESCKALAEGMKVPFTSVSIKDVTPNGYKGRSIETVIEDLYIKSGKSKAVTESGVIHFDEIDKLYTVGDDDISTLLEDSLLSLIEGAMVPVGRDKQTNQPSDEIDTSKITFILSGAFSGIEKQFKKERGVVSLTSNGKKEPVEFDYSKVTRENLRKYGVKNELIGRCSTITYTEKVSTESMMEFLERENGPLASYRMYFNDYGVDLVFDEDFLKDVVKKAIDHKTGMRGVESELSEITSSYIDIIEHFEGKTLVICNEESEADHGLEASA